MPITCPLCLTTDQTTAVNGQDNRRYYLCHTCALIFADPAHHLPLAAEEAHYRTHENSIENVGYVRFLSRLLHPVLPYLKQTMRGLDYGCGPGPTLSQLVRQQGIACADYDPIFFDQPLEPPYDFILSTECFEHFYHPHQDITRICGLLASGGVLGIMTETWTSLANFATWSYTRDPTHTTFYHATTFGFICQQFGFEMLWQDGRRVFILRRLS